MMQQNLSGRICDKLYLFRIKLNSQRVTVNSTVRGKRKLMNMNTFILFERGARHVNSVFSK